MKKHFIFLIIAFVAIATAFVACKKENDENTNLVIHATKVLSGNAKITMVEASISLESNILPLASDNYTNNSFKLALPKTVAEKYLSGDANGKLGFVDICAFDEYNKVIGIFGLIDVNKQVQVSYLYADKKFAVNETFIDEDENSQVWNCSFVKGWNTVYYEAISDSEGKVTTSKPSGLNLQWYFINLPSPSKNAGSYMHYVNQIIHSVLTK